MKCLRSVRPAALATLVATTLLALACGPAPRGDDAAPAKAPPTQQTASAVPPGAAPQAPAGPAVTEATVGHPAVHGSAGLVWSGLTREFVEAEILTHEANPHAEDGHIHIQVDPLSDRETERLIETELARLARANGGALTLQDDLTGEAIDVEFVRMQHPPLLLGDHSFFAVTEARRLDGPDQLLALDTWVDSDGKLGLTVVGLRIQAVREGVRRDDGPWTVRYERYVEGLRPVMTDDERMAALSAPDVVPTSAMP